VKIKLVHDVCGREILVRQVLETGGHCPWDGLPFNKDYTAVLAEALETAERAGGALENALERIAGVRPALTIERESILRPLDAHLDELSTRSKARR
jgi:hypothetical protein